MFTLAWPWMLLFLPLPWIIRRFTHEATLPLDAALKVPFFSRLQSLNTEHRSAFTRHLSFKCSLVYLAWGLLIFAASNPQWLGPPQALPQAGRDIMLAIDLSGSMQIPDLVIRGRHVNRLEAVKTIGSRFIEQREGDRLGLILFGTRAYLQTPLTFDRTTVKTLLNDASIALAGKQTAIGDAIGLGIKRLLKRPKGSRILILLTDGANNAGAVAPLSAAKLAAKNHIRIYTIGIGAESLEVPGLFQSSVINPSADLDLPLLKTMAKITGGMFFRAKETQDLTKAYQAINRLEPTLSRHAEFRPMTPLYPWPLTGVLCLLIGFMFPWSIFSLKLMKQKGAHLT